MLVRNIINFTKGNAAGAVAATRAVLITRPFCATGKTIAKILPAKNATEKLQSLLILYKKEQQKISIPLVLKEIYTIKGAPKSGEFWTQSVSSFCKKIIGK